MRSVLVGVAVGVLAGALCAAILSQVSGTSMGKGVAIAVVAVGCASLVWTWLALRGGWRKAADVLGRRRAREQRRHDLAASRKQNPTTRYGLEYDPRLGPVDGPVDDDETVMMGGKTRARLGAKHVGALLEQARAATNASDFRKAASLYGDLLDGSPGNVEVHVARGRIYLDLGDYIRAMSDFVVAEDLAPDSPLPLVAIGDLHFARKDYVRAIECYDIALSIAPEHAMAWCRRGVSHSYRSEHDQALSDLLHAKKLDSTIPNLDTLLATERRKAGEKPKGRKKR